MSSSFENKKSEDESFIFDSITDSDVDEDEYDKNYDLDKISQTRGKILPSIRIGSSKALVLQPNYNRTLSTLKVKDDTNTNLNKIETIVKNIKNSQISRIIPEINKYTVDEWISEILIYKQSEEDHLKDESVLLNKKYKISVYDEIYSTNLKNSLIYVDEDLNINFLDPNFEIENLFEYSDNEPLIISLNNEFYITVLISKDDTFMILDPGNFLSKTNFKDDFVSKFAEFFSDTFERSPINFEGLKFDDRLISESYNFNDKTLSYDLCFIAITNIMNIENSNIEFDKFQSYTKLSWINKIENFYKKLIYYTLEFY